MMCVTLKKKNKPVNPASDWNVDQIYAKRVIENRSP